MIISFFIQLFSNIIYSYIPKCIKSFIEQLILGFITGIITGFITGEIIEYYHKKEKEKQRKKMLSILMIDINNAKKDLFYREYDYTEIGIIITSNKLDRFVNSINQSLILLISYANYEDCDLLLELKQKGEILVNIRNKIRVFYNDKMWSIFVYMMDYLDKIYKKDANNNYPIAHYFGIIADEYIAHQKDLSEQSKSEINLIDEFVVNWYFYIKYLEKYKTNFKYINNYNISIKYSKTKGVSKYGFY